MLHVLMQCSDCVRVQFFITHDYSRSIFFSNLLHEFSCSRVAAAVRNFLQVVIQAEVEMRVTPRSVYSNVAVEITLVVLGSENSSVIFILIIGCLLMRCTEPPDKSVRIAIECK